MRLDARKATAGDIFVLGVCLVICYPLFENITMETGHNSDLHAPCSLPSYLFPFKDEQIVIWLLVPPGTHSNTTGDTRRHCLPPCPIGHATSTNRFLVKDPVKCSLSFSAKF